MTPFYWKGSTNFGDAMNEWLWPNVLSDLINEEDAIRLVGVGSLLRSELNFVKGPKVIFGTGSGYGTLPTKTARDSWNIYFVRGPLTAKALGIEPDKAITDAAWLISQIPELRDVPKEKSGTCFVPHLSSAVSGVWGRVCEAAGLNYINPLDDSKDVIARIAHSNVAIVESLHGAIIADYYRTPWIPISTAPHILSYKWEDWCQSLGLRYRPYVIPPSDFLDFLLQKRKPTRSAIAIEPTTVKVDESFISYKDLVYREQSSLQRALHSNKKSLRSIMNSVVSASNLFRNWWPISCWNDEHIDQLAGSLRLISKSTPHLSGDSIRLERINQLSEAVENLRRDYPQLCESYAKS